jgi:hypothetical protein
MISLNVHKVCFAGRAAVAMVFSICLVMHLGCNGGKQPQPESKCSEQTLIDAKKTIDKNVDITNPVSQGKAEAAKKDLDKSWDDYKAGRIKCKDFIEVVNFHLDSFKR